MSISRIAFYHLETLHWIARLGTFAAAAERLNTTQPAITARVRELEAQLGVALFRREGRLMVLTPIGRQIVRDSAPLLAEFQKVLLGSNSFAEARGVVRIGAGEIAAASCLPDFIAELQADLPHISLEVDIALTADLLQQIVKGRTDLIFGAGSIAHPALKTAPIGSVELLLLASPATAALLAEKGRAASVPLWSLSSQSPLYDIMRSAIAGTGLTPVTMNLSNNMRAMIDIVIAGNGIGVFPGTMVRAELAAGFLVPVPGVAAMPAVAFQAAIRATETDPMILAIFDRARHLDVSTVIGTSAHEGRRQT